MTTSAQLEREAERARGDIVDSLSELRSRMRPGRLVDETFDFARDGRAGQFVRNLGRQAADNPLPVLLIGAGVAWLMMGRSIRESAGTVTGRSQSRLSTAGTDARSAVSDASQRAAEAGGQMKEHVTDKASDMASDVASGISSNVDAARRTAPDLRDRVGATASDLAERAGAAGSSMGQAASSAADKAADLYNQTGQNARDAVTGFASFMKEQPIALAGFGIALGALLGAAFPATETENKLMGETSDAVKAGAAEVAKEQWEKGKAVASAAADKALGEVEQATEAPGLVPGDKHENSAPGVEHPEVKPSPAASIEPAEKSAEPESLHPSA
jgi:hypothetical protein